MSRAPYELPVQSRLVCLIVVGELVLVGEVLILIGIASTQPPLRRRESGAKVQRLFEQRRQQVPARGEAENIHLLLFCAGGLRRDATGLAGVLERGCRASTKPHRTKSEEPEEAIVIGVHLKGEEDIACPSQLEAAGVLEDFRSGRKCVPAHFWW
ncbi:Caskin1 [Symbiodinium sp. CCMP2592]|nr:Caskin1 [Symbiodinium sp. CCMP2592]